MITKPMPQLSPCFLSEDERAAIARERDPGATIREIAGLIQRVPSTVSRELRRNRGPGGVYRPANAHRLARARRARPPDWRVACDATLLAFIQNWLSLGWSPEQIAAALRADHPDRADRHLAVESIDQAIYLPGQRLDQDFEDRTSATPAAPAGRRAALAACRRRCG